MSMYLFIDTNIFLSFYKFGNDSLDTLSKVRDHLANGHYELIVTSQLRDEFHRKRRQVINEGLTEFKKSSIGQKVLRLGERLPRYESLKAALRTAAEVKASLIKDIRVIADTGKFPADDIIDDIFSRTKIVKITKDDVDVAIRRMGVGNPPGKNKSLGDAINWEAMLKMAAGSGLDLHIVSDDGDFSDPLDPEQIHEFLRIEYETKDQDSEVYSSKLRLHKTLERFLASVGGKIAEIEKEYYDLAISRAQKIEDLCDARTFHQVLQAVDALSEEQEFTLEEVRTMIRALIDNDQIRGVVHERQVRDFSRGYPACTGKTYRSRTMTSTG